MNVWALAINNLATLPPPQPLSHQQQSGIKKGVIGCQMMAIMAMHTEPMTPMQMRELYPQHSYHAWHNWMKKQWSLRKLDRVLVGKTKFNHPTFGYKVK